MLEGAARARGGNRGDGNGTAEVAPARRRLAAVAASLIANALLFPVLYRGMGRSAAGMSCLPVLLAGGLLGMRWGVGTALLGIPLHALLFALVRDPSVPCQ
jgi:hypothetical protein